MVGEVKPFRTRFTYNSRVWPANIEASLANRGKKHLRINNKNGAVKTKVFTPTTGSSRSNVSKNKNDKNVQESVKSVHTQCIVEMVGAPQPPQGDATVPDKVCQVGMTSRPSGMNVVDTQQTHTIESHNRDLCLLYDCQFAGVEDKFVNSILHNNNHKRSLDTVHTCAIFQQWQKQTDFKFGFIPCSEQELPVVTDRTSPVGLSFFNAHALVRATGRPNYMQARIPVQSQLNVEAWKYHLQDYWDQQLLQLIEFGFP